MQSTFEDKHCDLVAFLPFFLLQNVAHDHVYVDFSLLNYAVISWMEWAVSRYNIRVRNHYYCYYWIVCSNLLLRNGDCVKFVRCALLYWCIFCSCWYNHCWLQYVSMLRLLLHMKDLTCSSLPSRSGNIHGLMGLEHCPWHKSFEILALVVL